MNNKFINLMFIQIIYLGLVLVCTLANTITFHQWSIASIFK